MLLRVSADSVGRLDDAIQRRGLTCHGRRGCFDEPVVAQRRVVVRGDRTDRDRLGCRRWRRCKRTQRRRQQLEPLLHGVPGVRVGGVEV